MPRIGTMRCPCCGAREAPGGFILAYQCPCKWQDCHHCRKCVACCTCPRPDRPAWASKLAKEAA